MEAQVLHSASQLTLGKARVPCSGQGDGGQEHLLILSCLGKEGALLPKYMATTDSGLSMPDQWWRLQLSTRLLLTPPQQREDRYFVNPLFLTMLNPGSPHHLRWQCKGGLHLATPGTDEILALLSDFSTSSGEGWEAGYTWCGGIPGFPLSFFCHNTICSLWCLAGMQGHCLKVFYLAILPFSYLSFG